MTEKLLQFIWGFQYFNKNELLLDSGERLQILYPGRHNQHQGPDFLEAKIKIEETTLVGNIELHVHATDWFKHAHASDANYASLILHIVWQNDGPPAFENCPTLSLNNRVPKLLLEQYQNLMQSSLNLPCEKLLSQVNGMVWTSWKQRLLVERLQRKSAVVEQYLQKANQHWEEICWWMIAKNFGAKVNAEAFEAMAQSISVNTLAKHKNQIHQLEALLLGQAGLLEVEFAEDYPKMLKKEYVFLKNKYHLERIHMPVHFLRMRPSNFPTIRLAQLAMLVKQSSHLFSKIKEMQSVHEAKETLAVTANDFWSYHYSFAEASSFKEKKMGTQMIENMIINSLAPLLFAYGYLRKEPDYQEKALKWLEDLPSEKNKITDLWENAGVENKRAFDSQSLIELKTQYCDTKRCLECAIGNSLLKGSL